MLFLPSDSYDILLLKARIVILCSKGFEIMDLSKSVTFYVEVGCPH